MKIIEPDMRVIPTDPRVWGKVSCAMVGYESEICRPGLGHSTNWRAVHARQEIHPERRREASRLDLDVSLLPEKLLLLGVEGSE